MQKIGAILLAFYGAGTYASSLASRSNNIPARWRVEISREYELVGPFPQEAREQHFLNPGYPLRAEIEFPLDYTNSFPSHLVDDGFVYWKNASAPPSTAGVEDVDYENLNSVHYSITFPEVRWDSIRATEGWSGLQYHVLLHTKIRLIPPQLHALNTLAKPTYLALSASQCSYVAILDPRLTSSTPQWYTCNIYDLTDVPPIRIPLKPYFDSYPTPQPSLEYPGEDIELDILVSLDYEIRLFGDPSVSNNGTVPIIEVDLLVDVEAGGEQSLPERTINDTLDSLAFEPDQLGLSGEGPSQYGPCIQTNSNAYIFPHFVNGWAYGDAIGIEITSYCEEYWTVDCSPEFINGGATEGISLELTEPTRMAPSQTRLVSIRLTQSKPLLTSDGSLTFELYIYPETHSHGRVHKIAIAVPIQNHPSLSQLSKDTQGILLTYHSVSGTPASAVVLPPPNETYQITTHSRILLALHGAGVMHRHPFWISALPRPDHAWVLIVQGLTPWGLDWREASRADVCAALRTLVLRLIGIWREDDYCSTHDSIADVLLPDRPSVPVGALPVIAIGHSNGGQGALHLASLFPDCVPALIPAAGYTSARLYVPTQASRGSLFADAALQAIMRASLQGQHGDIVAGNLALSRVHLVHGGSDENVPVWHSRERMALIKNWNPGSDVNMTEVPGKPHFWEEVFKQEPVSSAIQDLVSSPYANSHPSKTPFTLTVVWPRESGSMHGWRMREAVVPGRLSRIRVNGNLIRTTNVHMFSIELSKSGLKGGDFITLDHQRIKIPDGTRIWFHRSEENEWETTDPTAHYPSGPLSSILTSARPIAFVIPTQRADYYETIALRIAHNLYTYLKLDSTIFRDSEVRGSFLECRSVVVIGGHHNEYGMSVRSSPLRVSSDGSISIAGERYTGAGIGALSLHQHHLYMDASDWSGYERILRMFPLRTGVPGPEWMIVGPDCDTKGYGGVIAAGFWDRNGGLSEPMSYFS